MERLSMIAFYLLLPLYFYINNIMPQYSPAAGSVRAEAEVIIVKGIKYVSYCVPRKNSTIDTLYTNPQIRLQSVKRFAATDYADTINHTIQITFIANLSIHKATIKGLEENETVHFNNEHIIDFEDPDKYGRLTVIANIEEENSEIKRISGVLDFGKEKNYGAGIQKLIIRKEVGISAPRNGPIARKTETLKILMPDYELTFEIKLNSLRIK